MRYCQLTYLPPSTALRKHCAKVCMYLQVIADGDGPDMDDVYEQVLFDGNLYGNLCLPLNDTVG